MKLANFIFGMVIFSIVTTMMFGAVQTMLEDNPSTSKEPGDWEELSGSYGEFVKDAATYENSTTRAILDQTELGEAGTETQDVTLLSGAISGGRMSFNIFTNFDAIISKVSTTSEGTAAYIDSRIIGAIVALVIVFLALVVLHFIRGFKTEV